LVTEKTVKVHRASAVRKMGAQSLPDLVRMAARLGITYEQPAPPPREGEATPGLSPNRN
jgi:hypothetical protein